MTPDPSRRLYVALLWLAGCALAAAVALAALIAAG